MGTKESRLKGGVITDGKGITIRIPEKIVKIFEGEPRIVFKKLEWYGIHPLGPHMLSRELQEIMQDYDIIAVPKEMVR